MKKRGKLFLDLGSILTHFDEFLMGGGKNWVNLKLRLDSRFMQQRVKLIILP